MKYMCKRSCFLCDLISVIKEYIIISNLQYAHTFIISLYEMIVGIKSYAMMC